LHRNLTVSLAIFFGDARLGERGVFKYDVNFSMDGADSGKTVNFAD
jgi:hypothetical protein